MWLWTNGQTVTNGAYQPPEALKRHTWKMEQSLQRVGWGRVGWGGCGLRLGILTHHNSKNTLLVLPAFLSVPQHLPQAVYPGPLFHSSVTAASALLHIFMLCFLSTLCLSGHQDTDPKICLCFTVC